MVTQTSSTKIPKQCVADIVLMRYGRLMNTREIAKLLNVSEKHIHEALEIDTIERINALKAMPVDSPEYVTTRRGLIKFMRDSQNKDYGTIAKSLGITENLVAKELNSPLKVENKVYKNKLNREEKRKRNNEIVRLNAEEGLTLEAIGTKFGISKQRVSDIMKSLGYVPLTGNKIRAIDKSVNKSVLSKKSIDTYNARIQEMGTEIRTLKQRNAMYKYNTGKVITDLRCSFLEFIINNWEHDKPVQQYKNLVKALKAYNTSVKAQELDELPPEAQRVAEILDKCSALEEKYVI